MLRLTLAEWHHSGQGVRAPLQKCKRVAATQHGPVDDASASQSRYSLFLILGDGSIAAMAPRRLQTCLFALVGIGVSATGASGDEKERSLYQMAAPNGDLLSAYDFNLKTSPLPNPLDSLVAQRQD